MTMEEVWAAMGDRSDWFPKPFRRLLNLVSNSTLCSINGCRDFVLGAAGEPHFEIFGRAWWVSGVCTKMRHRP
jgi:hypothetical protein